MLLTPTLARNPKLESTSPPKRVTKQQHDREGKMKYFGWSRWRVLWSPGRQRLCWDLPSISALLLYAPAGETNGDYITRLCASSTEVQVCLHNNSRHKIIGSMNLEQAHMYLAQVRSMSARRPADY